MSIRDKLLEYLHGNLGQVISGEVLSRQLGVSRTAVWKQILALKNAGLPIESAGRQGYRLMVPFDPSLIKFKGPSWVTPHYYVTTASTQSLAKSGALAGLPEGHLWIAETQSKGRGRLDRFWESAYGGLWASLLMRPKLSPARLAPLTLVAGLALRQAVESICGIPVKLKWPNDLMVRVDEVWRKCGGILTEMSGHMERAEWVVLGFGVNVNNAVSPELGSRAIALGRRAGTPIIRAEILRVFLDQFRLSYRRFLRDGFAAFQVAYWRCYFAPDEAVRVRMADGVATGKAVGVDAGGGLVIESRRKMIISHEGEIVL